MPWSPALVHNDESPPAIYSVTRLLQEDLGHLRLDLNAPLEEPGLLCQRCWPQRALLSGELDIHSETPAYEPRLFDHS